MKYYRSLVVLCCVTAMLLGFSSLAIADEPAVPTFRLECENGYAGDTVSVKLWLDNCTGLRMVALGLVYDDDLLEPLACTTNITAAYWADEQAYLADPPASMPTALTYANLFNTYTDAENVESAMVSYSLIAASPLGVDQDDASVPTSRLIATFSFEISNSVPVDSIPLRLVKFENNSWLRDSEGAPVTPQPPKPATIKVLNTANIAIDSVAVDVVNGSVSVALNEEAAATELTLLAALYDENDRMLASALQTRSKTNSGAVSVTLEGNTGFDNALGQAASCKVFLLSPGYSPLCAAGIGAIATVE